MRQRVSAAQSEAMLNGVAHVFVSILGLVAGDDAACG